MERVARFLASSGPAPPGGHGWSSGPWSPLRAGRAWWRRWEQGLRTACGPASSWGCFLSPGTSTAPRVATC